MGLILDTNFVIAVEREARLHLSGAATRFLNGRPQETLHITFTVAGELACGKSMDTRQRWRQLCHFYQMLPWRPSVSWRYGELYRRLQSQEKMIGVNDLWIAATALVYQMDLVTNNVDEFRRVEELTVVPF